MSSEDKSQEQIEKEAKFQKFSKVGKSNVRKSKSFERRVSDLIEEVTGAEFRRRRSEGRDNKTVAINRTADVISVDGDMKFSIEAKSGTAADKFDINHLLSSPAKSVFTSWWHQAQYDADILTQFQANGNVYYPFLIFKYTLQVEWLALPLITVQNSIIEFKSRPQHVIYDGYADINPISLNVSRTKNKNNFKFVPIDLQPVFFIRWKEFASLIKPETLFYVLPEKRSEKTGPGEETKTD